MTATPPAAGTGPVGDPARFSPDLLYSAARLYYIEEVNQAAIAARLGTSRATVSRMLSEARRCGIVRIDVVPSHVADTEALSARVAVVLGVVAVHITATVPETLRGSALAAGVSTALQGVNLGPGDVVALSSGRTVYDVTQADNLPHLPGVEVVPMIGGQDEPEAWYQTNEIVRRFAAAVGGHPTFLYAPALPGPELSAMITDDPTIKRVIEKWKTARCAVVGIGPPPLSRNSIAGFVPADAEVLSDAVGDVCARFYDRGGKAIEFPGSDRLISTRLDDLRKIPVTVAVAVGEAKVISIATAARAGYFNQLVTDTATATALIEHVTALQRGGRQDAGGDA